MIQMISTLVLRQESQQTIHHQDTGFMLFIQTSAPRNIAQSLYQIGQTWQSTKRDNPTALKSLMRPRTQVGPPDPRQQQHVQDKTVESLGFKEIEEALTELLLLAPELDPWRRNTSRPCSACSWRLGSGQRRLRRRGETCTSWPDRLLGPPA